MPNEWLHISVRADPSALDAIADYLTEQGSPGVVLKKRQVQGYIAHGDGSARLCADLQHFLTTLRKRLPAIEAPVLSSRVIKDRNWNSAWQKRFKPQRVARSFLICPPWLEPPPLRRRHLISIEPGLAFGTGTHATTRGCLEFLERVFSRLRRGKVRVLDVGTGSGILSIAAVKLGAAAVTAVDTDPIALKVAAENLRLNDAARSVRLGEDIGRLRAKFPVVVANLTAETILEVADGLIRRTAPGGCLILSGILRQKADGVVRRFGAGGFKLLERKREREWVTLLLKRK